MEYRSTFFILALATSFNCSGTKVQYQCFEDEKYSGERLCYEKTSNNEKDKIANKKAIELFKNIEIPSGLAIMKGDIAKFYTQEKFEKSLKKNHGNRNPEDIEGVLSTENYSVVFLKDGSSLYYSHYDRAFIVSFDTPIELAGISRYFGHGQKPKLAYLTEDESNCNIKAAHAVYVSPEKDSFYYSQGETYCSYNGMAFKKGSPTSVWPISKIGKSVKTNHSPEFSKFLIWLKYGHNKSVQPTAKSVSID